MKYGEIDWRKKENWDCNKRVHPTRYNTYEGISVNPLEVVFHKPLWDIGNNNYLLEVNYNETLKYMKWARKRLKSESNTSILIKMNNIFAEFVKINRFKVENLNLIEKLVEISEVNCQAIPLNEFLGTVDLKLRSLVIEPFVSPVLIGKNIRYFDVNNKEELIKRAKERNLDSSHIPDIDYVSPNADLTIIKEKFDIVFSYHRLEHQLDLIEHFNNVGDLLIKNGFYYMALPDKRYCFDHFITHSLLSDVLNSHFIKTKRHSLKTVLSECETTHNYPNLHWSGDNGEKIFEKNRLNCFKDKIEKFMESESDIDFHQWRFMPDSFVFIVNSLYRMGLIKLKLEKIFCTMKDSNVFYAILKKI